LKIEDCKKVFNSQSSSFNLELYGVKHAQRFQIIHKTHHRHNITADTSSTDMDFQVFSVPGWAESHLQRLRLKKLPQTRKLQDTRGIQVKFDPLSKLDITSIYGVAHVRLSADCLREDTAQCVHSFSAAVVILLFKRR